MIIVIREEDDRIMTEAAPVLSTWTLEDVAAPRDKYYGVLIIDG